MWVGHHRWLGCASTLFQVVAGTKDPYIFEENTRSSLGKRKIVIKVELVACSAKHTLSMVSFVNELLD